MAPKIEIEILRTATITRDESLIVEVDVPEHVLEDGVLEDWVDLQLDADRTPEDRSVVRKAIGEKEWDVNNKDECFEIQDVVNLSE